MPEICGLAGLRPRKEAIGRITCPPYDVIKPGSILEKILLQEEDSLYHITLGPDPVSALTKLVEKGDLCPDLEPCFYVYEQRYNGNIRTGVLAATRVYPYEKGEIIRHEKTFDDKVKGRLELRRKTGYTFEPVFLLTKSDLSPILQTIKEQYDTVYEFASDFSGQSELHGIKNRVFRVPQESDCGKALQVQIAKQPLFIADGHHRYHASLKNKQTHCLAYICEVQAARILAYNRVIKGKRKFEEIRHLLQLQPIPHFSTPPKHSFALYTHLGSYLLQAREVPEDLIGRLDCSILERELYPLLGLEPGLIKDSRYFDYYPETQLEMMKEAVNEDRYDLAVALHPVSSEELLAVASAGIDNQSMVMPEKSTFFAPKILSGIFIYRHQAEKE